MNRIKMRIFYIVMFTALIGTIVCWIFSSNKHETFDESKISMLSDYLTINSTYYVGIQRNFQVFGNDVSFSNINALEINKQIAAYVINNVSANTQYGYDECKECYKYFFKEDNIKFYDADVIEGIYNSMFSDEFQRITQEDVAGFNILYYNEKIDKYYVNVVIESYFPRSVSVFKNYDFENGMLYLDYYYFGIKYDETVDKGNIEKIYLYDINDVMINELMYTDLFDENNAATKYTDYIESFNIVRYVLNYDKVNKRYLLDSMKIL